MPQNKTFHHYLAYNHNKNNFNCQNINEEKTVSNLHQNNCIKLAPISSFGYDVISTKLIKTIKVTLIRPITLIINQMLNTGIFPDKRKVAKIMPIKKIDDETLFTNYIPRSFLNNFICFVQENAIVL